MKLLDWDEILEFGIVESWCMWKNFLFLLENVMVL